LEKAPDKVKSRSYDLVLNGTELGSGSIRIHDQRLQEKIFKVIGLNQQEAKQRFGFYWRPFNMARRLTADLPSA